MESVRCVIANIPQEILADIVQNLVAISSKIVIVGRVGSVHEVPEVLRQTSVDAVILGLDNLATPQVDLALPPQVRRLPIIGLDNDGRRLVVYVEDVGGYDLVKIIEALPTQARGHSA